MKTAVMSGIGKRGKSYSLDPEGNPVTFWVTTWLSRAEICAIEGVEDAVEARKGSSPSAQPAH